MNPLIDAGVQMGWHAVKRTFSVIATMLIIAGLGWAIYVTVVRPHTKPNATTKQEAESITNFNYDVKPTFGCMSFKVMKAKDEALKPVH